LAVFKDSSFRRTLCGSKWDTLKGDKNAFQRWIKGATGSTCDATCGAVGLMCDSDAQTRLNTNEKVKAAFAQAGYTCKSFASESSYPGSPFSTGRDNDDCSAFKVGKHPSLKSPFASVCGSNQISVHAPLCSCRSSNGRLGCCPANTFMDNPLIPNRKGTTRTGFGKTQNGFCVKASNQDENSGVTKLYSGNVKTLDQVKACWAECAKHQGVTACEAIWDQGNKGCYVHESTEIIRGNGVQRHYCALWNPTSSIDDSKVSFSCNSHDHIDAQDDTTELMFAPGEWNRNSHDPAAANYAIMDQLENFRNQHGNFLFKLIYPRAEYQYTRDDNQDDFTPVEMIWSQTSNPVTSEVGSLATNYVSYAVHNDNSACGWTGLSLSSDNLNVVDGSLLTGSIGESYFAIGATGARRSGFGGPCKSGYLVSQVELYVARPNIQQLSVGMAQTTAAEQVFRIDSESGQIFTTGLGGIDYESVPLYNLVVSAHDDGSKFHGGVVSTTKTGADCNQWELSVSNTYNTRKFFTLLSGHNFCRNPGGHQPYSWCFRASDGEAEQCSTDSSILVEKIAVRISIQDVNDPPSAALFKDKIFYVNENTEGGVTIGTVEAHDPDKNQALHFVLNAGIDSVPFDVDSITGEVRVVNAIDYEKKSEYRLSVAVHDSITTGGTSSSDIGYITIRIVDVNEPPTIPSNQKRQVNENSPRGTIVGVEIVAMDADKGGSLSFVILNGNGLGLFAMRACDGQMSVQNSKLLDYETLAQTLNIPVRVRVSDGEFYAETIVYVDVINMPESPVFDERQFYKFTIPENAAVGDAVGTVRATQPDSLALKYSLDSESMTSGLFSLHETTGVISISASSRGTSLDFETMQLFKLHAIATDTFSMKATVGVTVRVTDVNEAPIAIAGVNYYISEDTGERQLNWWSRFATPALSGYDADEGQTVTFHLVAGHGDDTFHTTTNGNRLFVKPGVSLDYESNRKYEIIIMVTDSSPNPKSIRVAAVVNVLNVNEAPVVDNSYAVILENSPRSTLVGDPMVARDPDTIFQDEVYDGAWIKLSSKGLKFGSSDVGKSGFDNKFAASPTRILRRVCENCGDTHNDIYYKRLTSFPSGSSIYDLLHLTWSSTGNTLLIDFNLYSTYRDAIAGTNPWSFCNYNDVGIGFPRDCGPNYAKSHTWQSSSRGGQRDWAWFVIQARQNNQNRLQMTTSVKNAQIHLPILY